MVKVTYKGETRDIPKRYLPDSLSDSQRKKQIKSIFEGKDRPKLKVKKRKSSCSNIFDRFKRVFAEAAFNKTKKNISPKKYYQNTLT